MVPYLVGKRLTKFLFLSIRLSPSLYKEGLDGEASWLDGNIRPRDFAIRLDQRLSIANLLLTLAHELVHVRQYVTNEMFDYAHDVNLTRWRKKVVNTDGMEHGDIPWEKDAIASEQPTVAAYHRAMKRRRT
jgi:hypothetical protein